MKSKLFYSKGCHVNDEYTVVPLPIWFVIIVTALFGLWPSLVLAEPVLQTQTADGIVITLHTEKCELKEVSNLPYRITWQEKGKSTEGCFGSNGRVVIFYFADKTVGVIPVQVFEKVIGV